MIKTIPSFLNEMLNKQYGEELTKTIIEGYRKKRLVSLRVNTIKTSNDKVKNILNKNNIDFEE